MKLSKRETRLIEQFMTQGMNLTANELATAAKVSTKTIYRTIKRINEAAGSEIIRSEIGKGFCLDYEAYLKGTIENQETDQMMSRLSGVMRLHCIYCLNHQSV